MAKANEAKVAITSASIAVGPFKGCLYGRNGMGKTHFAGSSDLKTLIIDCDEKGFESVADRPNVDVYQLTHWEQLDWIYWHLRGGKSGYEVVAIDTVTMLSQIALRWIMGDEKSRDTSVDPMMPDKRHYGKLGQVLGTTFLNWRNLPMHVLFLAQERKFTVESEDGSEQVSEIAPSLTPSALSVLLGCVGTVGRIYTREVTRVVEGKEKTVTQRRMLVGPHDRYVAKTRVRGMPRVVVNPRLDNILALRLKNGGEVPAGQVADGTAEEFI